VCLSGGLEASLEERVKKRMPETDLHRHIAKGDNIAALAYVRGMEVSFLDQDVDVRLYL
jgi:hypothetical protein